MQFYRTLFFVLILLAGVAAPRVARAANSCNQNCSFGGDCDSLCPVCEGACVTCGSLGNSAACTDPSTGASASCTWTGTVCTAVTPVPELPTSYHGAWLLVLPVALVGLALYRRRRRALPSSK